MMPATDWERFEFENIRRVAEAIEPHVFEFEMSCVCHVCKVPIDCDEAFQTELDDLLCPECWEEYRHDQLLEDWNDEDGRR